MTTEKPLRELLAEKLYSSEKLVILGQELVIYCDWEQLHPKHKEARLTHADSLIQSLRLVQLDENQEFPTFRTLEYSRDVIQVMHHAGFRRVKE